jgi:hypothetical protein
VMHEICELISSTVADFAPILDNGTLLLFEMGTSYRFQRGFGSPSLSYCQDEDGDGEM